MEIEKLSGEKMDAIDLKILDLLQKNAKLSSKEISAKVDLSITPTYERVKRLEKKGIIKRYTIEIDKTKLGVGLRVLCAITLKSHAKDILDVFERQIIELPEVIHCFHIAGNVDYQLLIETKDVNTYSQFLKDKLAAIPNIANVQSSIIMSTLK
jgi:Lrp/AsnC family transcriptional regulator, leucine-responsive regulatory protein